MPTFMILAKAAASREPGVMPNQQESAAMGHFKAEPLKAGVMLAGEGPQPGSKGGRGRFLGRNRSAIDGPFAETKEL